MEGTGTDQIHHITTDSEEYPERMRPYPSMPKELYYCGKLPADDIPTIGIIGARGCSPYGRCKAFSYAKYYSSLGIQVISGMALGIDGEAHQGALEGMAPTFAVLGCGVDVCYPAGNRKLYRKLKERGGLISEYPPGTPAVAWHFPIRNRIISALSDVLLVVEAREKSGSLITVDYALDQGKSVYAVPGAAGDALSYGCHRLIEQGAGIAYEPEVLLREYPSLSVHPKPKEKKNNLGLARDLDLVYSGLDLRPENLTEIVEKTGLPPGKVCDLMIQLEMAGLVREIGKNYYVKV